MRKCSGARPWPRIACFQAKIIPLFFCCGITGGLGGLGVGDSLACRRPSRAPPHDFLGAAYSACPSGDDSICFLPSVSLSIIPERAQTFSRPQEGVNLGTQGSAARASSCSLIPHPSPRLSGYPHVRVGQIIVEELMRDDSLFPSLKNQRAVLSWGELGKHAATMSGLAFSRRFSRASGPEEAGRRSCLSFPPNPPYDQWREASSEPPRKNGEGPASKTRPGARLSLRALYSRR